MQVLLRTSSLTLRHLLTAPTGSVDAIITGRAAGLNLQTETEAAAEMTASKDPVRKKPTDSQQDEEFVDVSPPQRNWKGIAISLLVIMVVCSLITLSVVVLTPTDPPDTSKSKLTVADLFKPEFQIHDPEARWINDLEVVYRNRDGHVVTFNFVLNETEVILKNTTFVSYCCHFHYLLCISVI
ncbi:hypothetical protein AMECASPLE_003544 [Ameca splendens]|uniref:Dipeptidyl aminopeptidase-like protein 6 n=1 Tax=Ameca splendens TaxID=208324 RepID=A0ABV0XZ05_9TELE